MRFDDLVEKMTGEDKSEPDVKYEQESAAEKTYARLAAARDQATKESNRFFVASVVLVSLYLIRASGLRVDLTLFEANVLKVPYGLFFFLLASQIALCMSMLRMADSASYKWRLQDYAELQVPGAGGTISDEYPNKYDWFSVTSQLAAESGGRPISKFIVNFSGVLTSLLALGLLLSPVLCGAYFLEDSNEQIVNGNRALQYWSVFGSTVLSGLWFINTIAVFNLSTYNSRAE